MGDCQRNDGMIGKGRHREDAGCWSYARYVFAWPGRSGFSFASPFCRQASISGETSPVLDRTRRSSSTRPDREAQFSSWRYLGAGGRDQAVLRPPENAVDGAEDDAGERDHGQYNLSIATEGSVPSDVSKRYRRILGTRLGG